MKMRVGVIKGLKFCIVRGARVIHAKKEEIRTTCPKMALNHVLENDVFEDDVDLDREDETLLYFGGRLCSDDRERAQFVENFGRAVKSWMSKTDDIAAERLLEVHLPTALRLSLNSPYKDVRTKMKKLLEEVQLSGYEIPRPLFEGPSSFVPKLETVAYCSSDEALLRALAEVQSLYEESFMHEGRLSNIVLLLGYHPSYLSCFIKSHDFLMHGNGPLPLHVRNYIAILAASRHKCSYLVSWQEAEFLKNQGKRQWLQGLDHLPTKMLNLLDMNKTLAHQPWFVKPDQMKNLLRGADSWSVAELVHAIVIMAHFHALAGFALGCGINPEIDTQLGHTTNDNVDSILPNQPYCSNPALGFTVGTPSDSDYTDFTDSEPISPVTQSPAQCQISETLVQHYIDTSSHEYFKARNDTEPKKLTDTLTETLKTLENESSSSDEENPEENNSMFMKAASTGELMVDIKAKVRVPTPGSVVKYLDDAGYEHEDFMNTSAVTLRARDYSWEDHGFPFVNSLYPDIAPLLDDKFTLAYQLTYRTCGEQKNIDTHYFREAIWYYIHSIKGIRHDDYTYRKVNQVLDIPFKSYIRMVACFPEKTTFYDFKNSMSGLKHSEKVHINVLVMEARVQAELIYALRAIMSYMKGPEFP